MVNSLVEYIIHWVNAFPSPHGASQTLSPSNIVTGRRKPNFSPNHIAFGTYAIVHAGTTNTMANRGIPAIALKPSNNRGGNYFMSLLTGRRLHAYQWTPLPTLTEVINRVHEMEAKEGRKKTYL